MEPTKSLGCPRCAVSLPISVLVQGPLGPDVISEYCPACGRSLRLVGRRTVTPGEMTLFRTPMRYR
jgi:hypothetical protein